MKKIISILAVVTLCVAMMLPITVAAETNASATLTGPDVVRAGDTITITFNLKGIGIFGASGTLSYDGNQLVLQSTTQKIAAPWAVEFNGNNFVAYDNNMSNPITGSAKAIFTVKFKVKSTVATGETIKVFYNNVVASDGNADANIGTITYSATVAAPLSDNNNLGSLKVNNATITPAFSANTTSYTASVPYDVPKLNISAKAADEKATVKINSPALIPGGSTDVTVTVTAENGSKKTYTIKVTREKDPNYAPSSNNNLSGITVEGFLLSPAFDNDITEYLVWLPYETESVIVNGIAAAENASVSVIGGENLVAGKDNVIKVICTAENGDKKEYVVIAKRAAAHGEEENGDSYTEPSQGSEASSVEPESSDFSDNSNEKYISSGFDWWWLLAVGSAGFIIGIIIGYTTKKS